MLYYDSKFEFEFGIETWKEYSSKGIFIALWLFFTTGNCV